MGRHRKPVGEVLDVAGTLGQASSMWGIPLLLIKHARKAGCTAFRSNKVYRAELLEWLAKNPQAGVAASETMEELKKQGQKLANEEKAIKVARAKRELVEWSLAKAEFDRALSILSEEAKGLMEPDVYRVWVTRSRDRVGDFNVEAKGIGL